MILAAAMLFSVLASSAYATESEAAPLEEQPLSESEMPVDPPPASEDSPVPYAFAYSEDDDETLDLAASEDIMSVALPPLYTEIPEGYYISDTIVLENVMTKEDDFGGTSFAQALVQEDYYFQPEDFILVTIEDDNPDNVSVSFQSFDTSWGGWGGNYYGSGLGVYGNYVDQLYLNGVSSANMGGVQIGINTNGVDTVDKITIQIAKRISVYYDSLPEGYEVSDTVVKTDAEIAESEYGPRLEIVLNQDVYNFEPDDFILVTLEDDDLSNKTVCFQSFDTANEGWGGNYYDSGLGIYGNYVNQLYLSGVNSKNIGGIQVLVGADQVDTVDKVTVEVARKPRPSYTSIPEGYFLDEPIVIENGEIVDGDYGPRLDIDLKQEVYHFSSDDFILVTVEDDDLGNNSVAFQSYNINWEGWGGNYYDTGLSTYGNYVNQLFLSNVDIETLGGIQVIVFSDTAETVDKVTVQIARKTEFDPNKEQFTIPMGYTVIDEATIDITNYEIGSYTDWQGSIAALNYFQLLDDDYHFRYDDYILVTLDEESAAKYTVGIVSVDDNWGGWQGLWSDFNMPAFGGYVGDLLTGGVTKDNLQYVQISINGVEIGDIIGHVKITLARNMNYADENSIYNSMIHDGDELKANDWVGLYTYELRNWERVKQILASPNGFLTIYYSGEVAPSVEIQYHTKDDEYPAAELGPDSAVTLSEDPVSGRKFVIYSTEDMYRKYLETATDSFDENPYDSLVGIFLCSSEDAVFHSAYLYVAESYEIPDGYTVLDTITVEDIYTVKNVWGEGEYDFSYNEPDGAIPMLYNDRLEPTDLPRYPLSADTYILVTAYSSEAGDNGVSLSLQSFNTDNNGWGGIYQWGNVVGAYVKDLYFNGVDEDNLLGINIDIGSESEGFYIDNVTISIAVPSGSLDRTEYEIPEGYDIAAEYTGIATAAETEWGYLYQKEITGPFDEDDYIIVTAEEGTGVSHVSMHFHNSDWSKEFFTDGSYNSIAFGGRVGDLIDAGGLSGDDLAGFLMTTYFYNAYDKTNYKVIVAKPHNEDRYKVPEGSEIVSLKENGEYAPMGRIFPTVTLSGVEISFDSNESRTYRSVDFTREIASVSVSFNLAAILDADGIELKNADPKDVLHLCTAVESGGTDNYWLADDTGVTVDENGRYTVDFVELAERVNKSETLSRICLCFDAVTKEDGTFSLPVGTKIVLTDVEWNIQYNELPFEIPGNYSVLMPKKLKNVTSVTDEDGSSASVVVFNILQSEYQLNIDDIIYVELEGSDLSTTSIWMQSYDMQWAGWGGYYGAPGKSTAGAYVKDLMQNGVALSNLRGINVVVRSNGPEPITYDQINVYIYRKDVPGQGERYEITEDMTVFPVDGDLFAYFDCPQLDFVYDANNANLLSSEIFNKNVKSITVTFDYVTVIDKDGYEIKPKPDVMFFSVVNFESWQSDWKNTATHEGDTYTVVFDDLAERASLEDTIRGIGVHNIAANEEDLPAGSKIILKNVKWDIVYNAIKGDANNNGEVTLEDAILTLKYAMGADLGGAEFNAAAANVVGDDDRITLEDAVQILKMVMNSAS